MAVEDHEGADADHQRGHQRSSSDGAERQEPAEEPDTHAARHQRGELPPEVLEDPLVEAERDGHRSRKDVFFDGAQRLRGIALPLEAGVLGARLDEPEIQVQEREQDQDDEGELPVLGEHEHAGHDAHGAHEQRDRQGLCERVLDRVEVGGDRRHEVADLRARIEVV